jgi:hypothetical protein
VQLAKLFEPALATLVAPSRVARFEDGQYDLKSPNDYCGPVSSVFSQTVLDPLRSIDEFARVVRDHESRFVTFNIKPLESIHTVEVRMHSGTVEARKILPWVSLWMQILWAAANRTDIPAGEDREVIVPDGDIIAMAQKYLPDLRNAKQEAFLRRVASRRSEVMQLWAGHPQLRPWLEHVGRWMPVPGQVNEA